MIAMLDTSEKMEVCAQEIGATVEQMLTPLTRFRLQSETGYFAVDNGAYAWLDGAGLLSLLERERANRDRCRWVAVPDVVGSAIRTLEVFDFWRPRLHGWPLALVMQDGQENLPIPWEWVDAVFIGGSTEWKMSRHAAACIKAAQAMEKWVHVGRVNTPGRWEHFEGLGVDSIDGSGLARFSRMREAIAASFNQPPLFAEKIT